ncbi:DUF523 domain-containing protein [Neobacillus niacini]
MFLVSSCLAGLEVRYNGTHSLNNRLSKLVEENKAVTICPELLGGFSTPREPAGIINFVRFFLYLMSKEMIKMITKLFSDIHDATFSLKSWAELSTGN